MADTPNFFGMNLTDPRALLAQQLMQNNANEQPLERAVNPIVAALMLRNFRDDQIKAFGELSGNPAPAPAPEQPGFFGRLFGSDTPSAPPAAMPPAAAPPLDRQMGVSPADMMAPPGSGSSPSAPPSGPPPAAAPDAGTPLGMPPAAAPPPAAQPPAGAGPSAPMAPPSMVNPGAMASQMAMAQRMITVGQKNGNLALVQQGFGMMQALREKLAESEIAVGTELGKQGMMAGPGGVSSGVVAIPNWQTLTGQAKAAESHGTEMGKLAPDVTQGMIGQTNAINTQTAGSAAAKAGAISHATALAENAPDVASLAASKAAQVSHATALAASAPDVATQEAAKATALAQAQAEVAIKTQPSLEAAKTLAQNAANANKPLTPEQLNQQEQKVSHDFQDSEVVKRYLEAVQAYKNVRAAVPGQDKASDIALVDSLVKMFNPQATVRQSTFENFMEHSQGIPSNVLGIVQSWYSSGQHLQPQTRQQLYGQATNYMRSARDVFNGVSAFTKEQAQRQGLNPQNVVPIVIDPLTADEQLQKRGYVQDPRTLQWTKPKVPVQP